MAQRDNFNWEVLPAKEAEEVFGVPVEKALRIVTAFINGSTKGEIARVFGVHIKVVSEIIEVARKIAQRNQAHPSTPSAASPPLPTKPYLLK